MASNARLFKKAPQRRAAAPADSDEEVGSRSELVYRKLRQAIETGELKPGQRVMEVDVADWLKVSRTPVREGLRKLEAAGMLTMEPRVGLVVASLSRQAMLELYVMREILEGTAAGLCARHASDVELLELEQVVRQEERLQGNYEALARLNRQFHDAIHTGAHNRYLKKSLDAVNDSMWLLGKSQMLLPDRAEQAKAEHAAIYDAIRKRDPDAAEDAARRHVRSAQQQRVKAFFPEGK